MTLTAVKVSKLTKAGFIPASRLKKGDKVEAVQVGHGFTKLGLLRYSNDQHVGLKYVVESVNEKGVHMNGGISFSPLSIKLYFVRLAQPEQSNDLELQ